MLFHSVDFAIFLPLVFLLYWYVFNNNIRQQNILILLASYIFYGWWDWRFLTLIIASSIFDFAAGLLLKNSKGVHFRQGVLASSILLNLGLLAFFKYYNFFVDSFVCAFTLLGNDFVPERLDIILPVGISFYTFQTMSYSIDVYRGKIEPTTDYISFFTFVSFFPQLVAGPIERAKNLLPQFQIKRQFDILKASDGMRQILWGLLKKIVIADNCAHIVDGIFTNYSDHSGSTLLLGAILFIVQLYCDFSGYSDIAIGTARLFGIKLMQNFAYPLFSKNIAEFWRRWHISLMTWLRDYVYKSLRSILTNRFYRPFNVMMVFLLCGLWHGADWSFVLWGGLNGLYHALFTYYSKSQFNFTRRLQKYFHHSIIDAFSILQTFLFISLTGVFFRAGSIDLALHYLNRLFTFSLFSMPEIIPKQLMIILSLFFTTEWLQRNKLHALEINETYLSRPTRWVIYQILMLIIAVFGMYSGTEFVYFAF